MPSEIVTVGFCPQYYSTWEVPSSDGSRTYHVTLNGAEHLPHCTCKAFEYAPLYAPFDVKDCRHIRWVWAHGCLFNPQWHDGGPNDYEQHGARLIATDVAGNWPHPCRGRCGQQMIAVRIAV